MKKSSIYEATSWTPELGFSYYDEDICKYIDDELFHIHQSYEKRSNTQTIKCTKCGSSYFNVGSGDYFTAIKCVNCKWEICIHQG